MKKHTKKSSRTSALTQGGSQASTKSTEVKKSELSGAKSSASLDSEQVKPLLSRMQKQNLDFCESLPAVEVAGVDVVKPLNYHLIQIINNIRIGELVAKA